MTSPALLLALSITFDLFMRAVTVQIRLMVHKITHISRFTAGGMNSAPKVKFLYQLFGSVYNGERRFTL
jgi:hypothetical protein